MLKSITFIVKVQTTKDGVNRHFQYKRVRTNKAWDSIFIGPGEGREIINKTNMPASMLVIIKFPD